MDGLCRETLAEIVERLALAPHEEGLVETDSPAKETVVLVLHDLRDLLTVMDWRGKRWGCGGSGSSKLPSSPSSDSASP